MFNFGESFIVALLFISIGFMASIILGIISFKLIEIPLLKKLSSLK
jgi:peptidoglycan/LPS O-acetylase OafA/YrhL